ncbi:unnamed protein product [Rhizopus microsporus]
MNRLLKLLVVSFTLFVAVSSQLDNPVEQLVDANIAFVDSFVNELDHDNTIKIEKSFFYLCS